MSDLTYWLAELSASLARIAAIRMEEYAQVIEPEAAEEFIEIEGVIYV